MDSFGRRLCGTHPKGSSFAGPHTRERTGAPAIAKTQLSLADDVDDRLAHGQVELWVVSDRSGC